MTLSPGSRLGPYEILSPLGAGGMGEVYRARDTRLDRTVAVKVLPSDLAQHPDRLARFEREARAVSALSHPNICALFDVGAEAGIHFLVLELIEGETLADRLQRGALPQEQALRIGVQVADALDKAHRAGIVHRDLKPGNVMLTKTGAKLLDFGLARIAEPAAIAAGGLSTFPTRAKPLTEAGSLLGTFQYMAPEQLEGREADARTDIFALGSVLYEMLTGKRAFEGKSQASLIAAILEKEPVAIATLQPVTPPTLERLVRRCLAKDPDGRWQAAADVADELKWIAEGGGGQAPAKSAGRRWVWVAAGLGLGLAAGIAFNLRRQPAAEPPRTALMASLTPPPGALFTGLAAIALSPDGHRLAFRALSEDGRNRIWVRPLDSPAAMPIVGTDASLSADSTAPNPFPFWSPDGHWLGFLADGSVKKVDLAGGRPITLCAVPGLRGATWGPGDVILLGALNSPILRLSAAGGTPEPVTIVRTGESHVSPFFLPDGRHFLFLSANGADRQLAVGSLDSQQHKTLRSVLGGKAYSPTGHVLYYGQEGVTAQRLRLDTLELSGEPRTIVESRDGAFLRSPIAASRDTLVLAGTRRPNRLAWLDRDGRLLGTLGPEGDYGDVALSRDGHLVVAQEFAGGTARLVTYEIATGTPTPVTTNTANWESSPIWSPDGHAIAFSSSGGRPMLKRKEHGWTNEPLAPFSEVQRGYVATSWSPDGASLIGQGGDPSHIWLLKVAERKLQPLIESPAVVRQATFSPDGRFVAFTSTQTGPSEIFVQAFLGAGERRQVSRDGGFSPRFSRDGHELFYLRGDRMLMAAPFDTRTGTASTPRALFRAATRITHTTAYDVADDGRFLFLLDQDGPPPLLIIRDWAALLGPGER